MSVKVMGFLNYGKVGKTLTQRKTGIFTEILQTFLSLSYLIHNSMSQELFGENSKRRNKKQEEKRKLNRKNVRELSDDKLYTIN